MGAGVYETGQPGSVDVTPCGRACPLRQPSRLETSGGRLSLRQLSGLGPPSLSLILADCFTTYLPTIRRRNQDDVSRKLVSPYIDPLKVFT